MIALWARRACGTGGARRAAGAAAPAARSWPSAVHSSGLLGAHDASTAARSCRTARPSPSVRSRRGPAGAAAWSRPPGAAAMPRTAATIADQSATAAHRRAEDRELVPEDQTDLLGRVRPRRGAAGDDPPARGGRLHDAIQVASPAVSTTTSTPRFAGQRAAPRARRPRPGSRSSRRRPASAPARACSSSPDVTITRAPSALGDRQGGQRDTAADPVHQHALAGLEPGPRDQHPPRRQEGQRERRRLLPRQVRRLAGERLGLDRHELGERARGVLAEQAVAHAQRLVAPAAELARPAPQPGVEDDLVPGLPPLNVLAHGDDLTRTVGATDVRQAQLDPGDSTQHEEIQMVERRGLEPDEDLAPRRARVGTAPERELPRRHRAR